MDVILATDETAVEKERIKEESDSEDDIPFKELNDHKSNKDEKSKSKYLKKLRKVDKVDKADKADEIIASFMKLKCEICNEEFDTFSLVWQHYRIVHNQRGYVICCNTKLSKRTRLLDHVNRHINPEYFK